MRVFISESLRSRTKGRVKKVPPLKVNPAFDIGEGDGPSCLDDQYHDDIGEQLGRPQPENHAMSKDAKTSNATDPDELIHLDTTKPDEEAEVDSEEFASDLDSDADTAKTSEPDKDDKDDKDEPSDAEEPSDTENVNGDVADKPAAKAIKESTKPPATENENADDKHSMDSPTAASPDSSRDGSTDPVEHTKAVPSGGKNDNVVAGKTKSEKAEPAFFKMTPSETSRQSLFSLLGAIGVSNTRNILYRVEKDGVHVRSTETAGTIKQEEIANKFDSVETFTTLLRRNGGIPY